MTSDEILLILGNMAIFQGLRAFFGEKEWMGIRSILKGDLFHNFSDKTEKTL